jgi:hypothetical protein
MSGENNNYMGRKTMSIVFLSVSLESDRGSGGAGAQPPQPQRGWPLEDSRGENAGEKQSLTGGQYQNKKTMDI